MGTYPIGILRLIAGYHNLIYYGVIAESLSPCTAGLSCSAKQLEIFGFITIPLLSFLGFGAIGLLLLLDKSIKGTSS